MSHVDRTAEGTSPRHDGRGRLRRVRRRDGRHVLCGGAALRLVLPRDRLRRPHPGRDRGAAGSVGRTITVRFDANVAGGLPWRFEPEQTSIQARLGEVVTVNYLATNLAARETLGQAAYNVAPATTGIHFQKINCFCFTEQRLGPGEKREMPVVFYIDPALAKDAELTDLNTITLSYSFYALREPARPVADRGTKAATTI